MQLLTNEIKPDAVSRTVENGTEYLTAPVVMAVAQRMNGGYLPKEEIHNSADKWDGIDVPINHPTKNGQAVSVEESHDNPVIGEVRNAKAEGEKLLGELWIEIQKAKQAGTEGVQVLSRLASGEPLEVSTAYIPNTVEENTKVDGKNRNKVVRDIEPDHLAVLPNDKGRCSVSDGCGAPVANQVMIPMADDGTNPEDMGNVSTMHGNQNVEYEVTDVTPEDVSGYTDREWNGSEVVSELPNPSESENAASILDETHMLVPQGDEARDSKSNWKLPFRAGADEPINTRALVAIDAALSGGRGGVGNVSSEVKQNASELTQAFLVDAPGDLFGSVDAEETESNSLERVINRVASLWNSSETAGAESPVDSNMDRETMIEALATNTNLKRDSLEGLGDNCLKNVYTHRLTENAELRANAEIDWNGLIEVFANGLNASTDEVADALGDLVPDSEQNMEQNDTNDDSETVELTENELEELVDKKVEERLAANEQSDLIDEIFANSEDYDREVLEETPQEVLEDIHNDVTGSTAANLPHNVGRKAPTENDASYSGPTDFGEYIKEAE